MRWTKSVRRRTEIVQRTECPVLSDQSDLSAGSKRKMRPCPRDLEDTCPIPRELCVEEYRRVGRWNCEKLLDEFEWFVFEDEEEHGHRSERSAEAEKSQ